MAWLRQLPSGHYYICFRFGGRRFKRSLKTKNQRIANSKRVRLEDTISLVEAGRVDLPAGVDIPTFFLSEGKISGRTVVKDSRLGDLFDRFFKSLPEGNLEASSIKTMKTHRKHVERILGTRRYVGTVAMADLQTYIQKRSTEKGIRGRNVGADCRALRDVGDTSNILSTWSRIVQVNQPLGASPRFAKTGR